ncbi:hypothetical protein [Vogesella indigofera]|uniref:hypothetical protein n=1 Tax=Vogesella indigofera TaxID=45465 RepID=UPI00234F4139|nr:hypothetical protein [Vogesella indigofera]MDC7710053.1 hypothetical protein [Vogesella indigofera]
MQTSNPNVAGSAQQGRAATSPDADAEYSAAFTEVAHSGALVDWDYWSKRKKISPHEAAMLANSIDPSRVESNGQQRHDDWGHELRMRIEKMAIAFAEECDTWTLKGLAEKLGDSGSPLGMRHAVAQSHKSVSGQSSPNTDDWREKARQIADEFFANDTQSGVRDSLQGYSKRVMEEMQAQKIHSPRGQIVNPNTIQRDALQGDKWWKKQQK